MRGRKLWIHCQVLLCELGRMLPQPGIQIHCAGLDWQGAGVMLVGPSCRGKSTLVQLLVCNEFRVLQDQLIGLTSADHLRGNRFPGWLRSGGFEAVRQELVKCRPDVERWVWTRTFKEHYWMLPPVELRSRGQVPLRLIVEVQFNPGAPVRLEPVPPEIAAELLQGELRDSRPEGPARMAEIAARFRCVRLTYGRAGQHPEVAAVLKALL